MNNTKVIFLKPLPIVKEYKRIARLKNPIYYAYYDITKPKYLSKDAFVEVKYTRTCSVVILYHNRYFWCPLFESIYKDTKSETGKKTLRDTLIIERVDKEYILTCTYNRNTYKTGEVVKLKLKKDE